MTVDELVVFSSTLSPAGPTYEPLGRAKAAAVAAAQTAVARRRGTVPP